MKEVKHLLQAVFLLVCFVFVFWIAKNVFATRPPVEVSTLKVTAPAAALTPVAAKGKELFQQNCQSCHAVNKNLTGPALAGLESRGPWSDRKALYDWIRNPAAFMQKDAYTQGLKAQYGSLMPGFPQLSTEDIDAIVTYIQESEGGAAPSAVARR